MTEVSNGNFIKAHTFVPKTNFAAQQTSLEALLPKVTSTTPEVSLGNLSCTFMSNYNIGRVPTTDNAQLLRQFFANQGGFCAAYLAYASKIPTKNGGKLTKRWALAVVGTRPSCYCKRVSLLSSLGDWITSFAEMLSTPNISAIVSP